MVLSSHFSLCATLGYPTKPIRLSFLHRGDSQFSSSKARKLLLSGHKTLSLGHRRVELIAHAGCMVRQRRIPLHLRSRTLIKELFSSVTTDGPAAIIKSESPLQLSIPPHYSLKWSSLSHQPISSSRSSYTKLETRKTPITQLQSIKKKTVIQCCKFNVIRQNFQQKKTRIWHTKNLGQEPSLQNS